MPEIFTAKCAQRWLRPQPNKDLTQRRKGAEKQKKSRPLFSFTSLTSLRLRTTGEHGTPPKLRDLGKSSRGDKILKDINEERRKIS
ncbi:MAG: hypothetical protein ABSB42_12890 [Tepidisphaeraceae bacterium]